MLNTDTKEKSMTEDQIQ